MKYKLLVLDVDGTLLNDKKEITPDPCRPVKGSAEGSSCCIGIRPTHQRGSTLGGGS